MVVGDRQQGSKGNRCFQVCPNCYVCTRTAITLFALHTSMYTCTELICLKICSIFSYIIDLPPEDGSCDETSNADSESPSDSDSDPVPVYSVGFDLHTQPDVALGTELGPEASKNLLSDGMDQPSSTKLLPIFHPADGIKQDIPLKISSVFEAINGKRERAQIRSLSRY